MRIVKRLSALVLSAAMVLGTLTAVPAGRALADTGEPDWSSYTWTPISSGDVLTNYFLKDHTEMHTAYLRLDADINLQTVYKNWLFMYDGDDITIDLNGHSIYRTGYYNSLFTVNSGAKLTVCDTAGGGEIRANLSTSNTYIARAVLVKGGSFDMYGGKIRSTITGTATNNGNGPAVRLESSAVMNMYGGEITGFDINSENGYSTVSVFGGSVMNMYGGSIHGNKAKYAGNVEANGGSFNMYGGEIYGGSSHVGDLGIRALTANSYCNFFGGSIGDRIGNAASHAGHVTVSGGWFAFLPDSGTENVAYGEGLYATGACADAPDSDRPYTVVPQENYTITFLGADSSDIGVAPQVTSHGSSAVLPGFDPGSGKSLLNWNTKADGSGIEYARGDSLEFSGDVTLYAQLSDKSVYDVKLYIDDVADPQSGTLEEGTVITVPTPEIRTYFRWDGYSTAAGAAPTDEYLPGMEITVNSDLEIRLYTNYTELFGAEADGTAYHVFDDAFTASNIENASATIKLLGDTTYSWSGLQTLKPGAAITVDLNGFTLTATDPAARFIGLTAGTALTIKDSSPEGTGRIYSESSSTSSAFINNNGGTIVIDGGTIELKGTFGSYDFINSYSATASVTVNDGRLIAASSSANPMIRRGNGSINIYGGFFACGENGSVFTAINDTYSYIHVYGGWFARNITGTCAFGEDSEWKDDTSSHPGYAGFVYTPVFASLTLEDETRDVSSLASAIRLILSSEIERGTITLTGDPAEIKDISGDTLMIDDDAAEITVDLAGHTVRMSEPKRFLELLDGHVTIKNGTILLPGEIEKAGHIFVGGGTLELEKVTINGDPAGGDTASAVGEGGAVNASSGTIRFAESRIANCLGGAMRLYGDSTAAVIKSVIENCSAQRGGALYVGAGAFALFDADSTVRNCTGTAGGALVAEGLSQGAQGIIAANGTITGCVSTGTSEAPIYSSGFVFVEEALQTSGIVWQYRNAASIESVSAQIGDVIKLSLEAQIAFATDSVPDKVELRYNGAGARQFTEVSGRASGLILIEADSICFNHMADDLEIALYLDGERTGEMIHLSVQDYLYRVHAAYEDEKTSFLIAQILEAADQLQQYAEKTGHSSPGAPVTHEEWEKTYLLSASIPASTAKLVTVPAVSEATDLVTAVTLNITDRIIPVFKVRASAGTVLCVSAGGSVILEKTFAEAAPYYEAVPDDSFRVTPADYDLVYTVTLRGTEGKILHQVTYSVNSYAFSFMKADKESAGLALSLYRLGRAAGMYTGEVSEPVSVSVFAGRDTGSSGSLRGIVAGSLYLGSGSRQILLKDVTTDDLIALDGIPDDTVLATGDCISADVVLAASPAGADAQPRPVALVTDTASIKAEGSGFECAPRPSDAPVIYSQGTFRTWLKNASVRSQRAYTFARFAAGTAVADLTAGSRSLIVTWDLLSEENMKIDGMLPLLHEANEGLLGEKGYLGTMIGEGTAGRTAADGGNTLPYDVYLLYAGSDGTYHHLILLDAGYVTDEATSITAPGLHLIRNADSSYGGTLNASLYGSGAPLNGASDIEGDIYYTRNDYYNLNSTETRTILPGFETYQQTMADTSGIACVLMAANYMHMDVYNEYTELALTEKYQELTGTAVYKNGTDMEGLTKLARSIGLDAQAGGFKDTTGTTRVTQMNNFRPWIIGLLSEGKIVLMRWHGVHGYEWLAVIGYDTMGTEAYNDDVIIAANPFDDSDHYQDGYYTMTAGFLYRWWLYVSRSGADINTSAGQSSQPGKFECVIITPDEEHMRPIVRREDNMISTQEAFEKHLILREDGNYGGTRNEAKYGNGVAFNGANDHPEANYYALVDYYTLGSAGTRIVVPHWMQWEQTMASSCGISSMLSTLYYHGCDLKDDQGRSIPVYDWEVQLVDWYESISGKVVFNSGIGASNAAAVVNQKVDGFSSAYGCYYKSTAQSAYPYPTYESFRSDIKAKLTDGNPLCVSRRPYGGHWETIIGFDDMGTETMYDDVIILGDSGDGQDHYQDGYNTLSAVVFYNQWYNGSFNTNQQYFFITKD